MSPVRHALASKLRCALPLILLTVLSACTHTGHMYNLATGEVSPFSYSANGTGRGSIDVAFTSGEDLGGE